jgi:hypothetical protein
LSLLSVFCPPITLLIFGAWKDRQTYDSDLAAAYTKQGTASLASQLIAPIDSQLGKQVAGQDLQAPPAGAMCGITHIAVLPEKGDDFYAALVKYTEATRRAVGNLRYFPAQDFLPVRDHGRPAGISCRGVDLDESGLLFGIAPSEHDGGGAREPRGASPLIIERRR